MALNNKLGVILGSTIGVPITFTLEVLGAAGAIWGSSEVLSLRNEDNREKWDMAAIIVGVSALIRYLAKYVIENSRVDRQGKGFCGGLWHAMVAPHEAIKDAFFEPVSNDYYEI